MNLSTMTTAELQERLSGNSTVHRTEDEERRQVEAMPLEVLLMHAEYIRRNMQPLRQKQLTTYEDAAKHIVIPELLRRLQMADAATADLLAKLRHANGMLEANGIRTGEVER